MTDSAGNDDKSRAPFPHDDDDDDDDDDKEVEETRGLRMASSTESGVGLRALRSI
jgi:hypothetical protein